MALAADPLITIGALAKRTGVAVSALRFYEERGLIAAIRTAGNQRRFLRSDIRRVSFVLIAQRLGLGLAAIEQELAQLPAGRAPSAADWHRIGRSLRVQLDEKIQLLNRARGKLDQCIGCGCLSLAKCPLTNKDDRAGAAGPGPRFVLD
ncbi:MAG: redox-sensitive transcriptional activator SoxR [Novosphingobium sp.]|nr:redox-sensitive transcriptional activator SoxR [Novosphingobium sp.]